MNDQAELIRILIADNLKQITDFKTLDAVLAFIRIVLDRQRMVAEQDRAAEG